MATKITCGRLNSVSAESGTTYKFSFTAAGYINLHNDTDGIIRIADTEDAPPDKTIFVDSGCGYSDLFCGGILYITAEGNGNIQIVGMGG